MTKKATLYFYPWNKNKWRRPLYLYPWIKNY
jgi:hypothetical protein